MNCIVATTLAGALTFLFGAAYAGEQPTEEQMLEALKPRITRSMTESPADVGRADTQHAIDILRQGQTRSLSSSQREQVSAVAKERPKIDLEIYFDYRASGISPKAVPSLDKLGKVLTNPDLKGSVFMIAGYTDAKGSDSYNLTLSERRAGAVRKYLIDKFGLPADSLTAVGYGKEHLKDPQHPYAPENRRVQVVNMAEKSIADTK